MKRLLFAVALIAAPGIQGQNAPAQAPKPSADPYANNPNAGIQSFPLAAPAGRDSGAFKTPLPGAVNQGPIDPSTWKYGPQNKPPADAKIWNQDRFILHARHPAGLSPCRIPLVQKPH